MSDVAQKLCDEIVEPALKTSAAEIIRDKPSKKLGIKHSSSTKSNGNVTRSVVIEKKKVINKLIPHESEPSATVINQYRSREVMKKKYADMAINTLVTGPLRCDNDCITMVRKRDNRCSCKCQKHTLSKSSVKQIQTCDNLCIDKACAQLIETVNCGTQFLEKLGGGGISGHSSHGPKPKHSGMNKSQMPKEKSVVKISSRHLLHDDDKPLDLNYMSARRWALSKYPTRGPDF